MDNVQNSGASGAGNASSPDKVSEKPTVTRVWRWDCEKPKCPVPVNIKPANTPPPDKCGGCGQDGTKGFRKAGEADIVMKPGQRPIFINPSGGFKDAPIPPPKE